MKVDLKPVIFVCTELHYFITSGYALLVVLYFDCPQADYMKIGEIK